ncbi:hypothetical protein LSTR_LSTR013751 [Laodelphax striatellus]|uniref:Uncharacterized protein n=1 Tax=Laodelphax striatellus TaxID=195883 RepID=A0A482WLE9_LAOST|nr:hypothetical protein LSTR_LSTR013751 [Laodelphax striatellus]
MWSDELQVLHNVETKVIVSEDIDISELVGTDIEVSEVITPNEYLEGTLDQFDNEDNIEILAAAEEVVIDDTITLFDSTDPNYVPVSDENSSDSSCEENFEEVLLNNTTSSYDSTDCATKKRKRNRKAAPAEWEKNKIKKLRMSGKKYTGYKRTKVNGKMVVSRTNFEKEERKIGPHCKSKVCMVNKKRKCTEFKEAERIAIFKKFWELTWKEKEIFVCANVNLSRPKVSTCKGPSRRSGTVTYRLKHEGALKPVCKKFFLNTLGLGEWTALNWIRKNESCSADGQDEGMDDENQPENNLIQSAKRRSMVKTDSAREWLEMLPKLPSHYARKDTNKLYLEPIWESKSSLYREYQKHSLENNKPCASLALFSDIFEEMNLSIFSSSAKIVWTWCCLL